MGAAYGQHFLADKAAVRRIVEALGVGEGDVLLEIGPGKGALTALLLQTKAARVVAAEVDPRMVATLATRLGTQPRLDVLNQDILEFSWAGLPKPEGQSQVRVVGNLPYNLTSPILRRLCEWRGWTRAVVMVQKEVGDRLAASPGESEYGALTVGVSLFCQIRREFDLTPEAFSPPPKVHSTVLVLTPLAVPLTEDPVRVTRVVQAAFQQRRKTLLNSLSHGLGLGKTAVQETLDGLGIDAGLRPERLAPADFVRLSTALPI